MLRNNVLTTINFLYPIGNTPATDLTQGLPPGHSADILLLGCGDVRNILFTTYAQIGARRLDFTCCDIEPGVLVATDVLPARNILLLTLILDDKDFTSLEKIWNIYYHWKIDLASQDLLKAQLRKLLRLSSSLHDWNSSPYSNNVLFCDHQTFRKVSDVWRHCDKEASDDDYKFNLEQAKLMRDVHVPKEAVITTGLRSAAPLGLRSMQDLPDLHKRYHQHGGIFKDQAARTGAIITNRTFFATGPRRAVLHYGTDPLLGFHLATAYAPLSKGSPLACSSLTMSSSLKPLLAAQHEFQRWAKAFRKAAASGIFVRYFAGDVLTFCHTLQHAGKEVNNITANLKVHSSTFETLILLSHQHGDKGTAPTTFDVIDTSNLTDHIGALNLLTACRPLLRESLCSSLHLELLVKHEGDVQERIANLLCGDLGTVSLLFGLSVVEAWTNTTAAADVDEAAADSISSEFLGSRAQGSTQLRTRITWKSLVATPPVKTCMNTEALIRVLHRLYLNMFGHERISLLMENLSTQGIGKVSNPFHTRLSFAALLKVAQSHIEAEWEQVIQGLVGQSITDDKFTVSNNYAQELYTYFHLLGLHTVPRLQLRPLEFPRSPQGRFSGFKDLPSVVCVTIQVPRSKLQFLTQIEFNRRGTPSIRCTVTDGLSGLGTWCNDFGAVQLAYGKAVDAASSPSDLPEVIVEEDDNGIHGSKPLIASFFVPTWTLLQDDQIRVLVGLQSTPLTAYSYVRTLGPMLHFFEAQLANNSAVFISKGLPQRQSIDCKPTSDADGHPLLGSTLAGNRLPVFSGSCPHYVEYEGTALRSMTAEVDAQGEKVISLSCKILVTGTHKAMLENRETSVATKALSALEIQVNIGKLEPLVARFQRPVNVESRRLRVARKSSYVELIAHVFDIPSQIEDTAMLFPISLEKVEAYSTLIPVCWTMPYVNLDILPHLELHNKEKMSWFVTHASLMFSNRERGIKEANFNNVSAGDMRVDFKESLFSIFMQASALQGSYQQIFSLSKSGTDESLILIFVSLLKLDLANRTVIGDAAVLYLTETLGKKPAVQKLLQALMVRSVPIISLNDKELRLWKMVLPVYAERCRSWSHRAANCEYLKAGRVPPPQALNQNIAPFCSCGEGHIPKDFMKGSSMPNLDGALRYATRIAISPCFAMPYIEDCIPKTIDSPKDDGVQSGRFRDMMSKLDKCAGCGKMKRFTEDGTEKALLHCAKCRVARYCSTDCQRGHWKEHKAFCKRAAQSLEM